MQHDTHIDRIHSRAISSEIGDRLREALDKSTSAPPDAIEARLNRLRESEGRSPSLVPSMEDAISTRRYR